MGYQTRNFINEIGTLFIVMVVMLGFAIIALLLMNITCKRNCFLKLKLYLRRKIFFNGLLRMFIESYLEFTICCLIDFTNVKLFL